MINRFDRELNHLEQEYAHEILGPQQNNDDDNTETILGLNYEKMIQALNDLGFIPSTTNIGNHDQ